MALGGLEFATPEKRPKILVVDDNEQNRALAQATLEDEGYEIILANSGQAGIDAFQREAPDCVLLDIRMPGMDGLTACQRIRELPGGASTPIVFLTAARDVDTFDAALRAGGDDFLTKPLIPTNLVLRLQAALKLRRLSESNLEQVEIVRRQRDDLMRLQLQKERLMAFVVHDLKNPVNSMDLQAQLLLRQKELPERVYQAATSIRDDVRSLMRLILNLLDINKGEEGQLTPSLATVNLEGLLGEVHASLDARARAGEIVLESRLTSGSVRADPDLLRRVLENLIENAIRHAPANSSVRTSASKREGVVQIRVTDRGTGIPPELSATIFERFAQLGSGASTSRTGRGLGLSFCKFAVEAHGGRIWVEDGDPGAAFCLEFPDEH